MPYLCKISESRLIGCGEPGWSQEGIAGTDRGGVVWVAAADGLKRGFLDGGKLRMADSGAHRAKAAHVLGYFLSPIRRGSCRGRASRCRCTGIFECGGRYYYWFHLAQTLRTCLYHTGLNFFNAYRKYPSVLQRLSQLFRDPLLHASFCDVPK